MAAFSFSHVIRRLPAPVTLSLVAWCGLIAFLPAFGAALQFEREAILSGQVWRVLTGHLTHWNGEHLFWDVAMFAVLGWMLEARDRRCYAICLFTSAVAISAAMWFALPELERYRGLSGVDTALFTWLAIGLLRDALRPPRPWDQSGRESFSADACSSSTGPRSRKTPDPVALAEPLSFASRGRRAVLPALLLMGLLTKIAFEYLTSEALFVNAERAAFTPVPLAHLVGAVVGLAMGWIDGAR